MRCKLCFEGDAKIVGCYFSSWAYGRAGEGAFDVENIDPFICTHGFYAFATLNPSTYEVVARDPGHDLPSGGSLYFNLYSKLNLIFDDVATSTLDNFENAFDFADAYQRFTSLSQQNPNFKPMLSVGGGDAGVTPLFSQMASSAATRQVFINSAINYLYLYGFVGLDVDWEYPTFNGGSPQDFQNFITLLSVMTTNSILTFHYYCCCCFVENKKGFFCIFKELRAAFDERNYLLSAAVNAQRYYINSAYDVPNVARF